MSSATSTVPVVLSTLVGLLKASPDLAGSQVSFGDTGQAERKNIIITGRLSWPDEKWTSLGAADREEQYVLDGFAQVRIPGDSQQESLEQCFALVAVLERVLRSMVTVPDAGLTVALSAAFGAGNAQVTNLEFKPTSTVPFPTDEGRAYQIDFGIRVTARI